MGKAYCMEKGISQDISRESVAKRLMHMAKMLQSLMCTCLFHEIKDEVESE